MDANGYRPGLAGVIATETRLSHVDGERGELLLAGFPLAEIAGRATFTEMSYLLWNDRLPTDTERADFEAALAAHRALPAGTLALLREAAQAAVPPMDALRMAAASLDLALVPDADDAAQATAILAALPTIVASYWRLLQGEAPIAPNGALGHAANYLYMLSGEPPSDGRRRAFTTYLNTIIDHGLNASTFTARVIVSTRSDFVSAITGALGALKGPLHGGAPGPALEMVWEIGRAERAETILREKLARGERLMGFGHRVYKVRDPRADVLAAAAQQLFAADGDRAQYELALAVEAVALRLLAEQKPERKLQTNVEFYTALLLHGIELPVPLFTPTFALGRAAGWLAHCLEQRQQDKLIRPSSRYVGQRRTLRFAQGRPPTQNG
ncbi:MAG: citrate synthase/methylcitrate synthase [Anaerolineales bacterium]|nr:citrate synthase/methylcitrate synthase [Anaerolineales bacterium]MCB9126402.1 citrate synthase/methylcitrate synthase [Ardenticatenales bacterium]MCB9171563.1 citrate synthase/methylcitrate synthase [Ardenticatenales bacterium]